LLCRASARRRPDIVPLSGGERRWRRHLLAERSYQLIVAVLQQRFGAVPRDARRHLLTIIWENKLKKLNVIAAMCPDLEAFRQAVLSFPRDLWSSPRSEAIAPLLQGCRQDAFVCDTSARRAGEETFSFAGAGFLLRCHDFSFFRGRKSRRAGITFL
jgi:hypothetical protein